MFICNTSHAERWARRSSTDSLRARDFLHHQLSAVPRFLDIASIRLEKFSRKIVTPSPRHQDFESSSPIIIGHSGQEGGLLGLECRAGDSRCINDDARVKGDEDVIRTNRPRWIDLPTRGTVSPYSGLTTMAVVTQKARRVSSIWWAHISDTANSPK